MSQQDVHVIVLAAGKGTRMKSNLPKVLHPIGQKPMVSHVLDAVKPLAPKSCMVVAGPDMSELTKVVHPHDMVVQQDRLGTGHAVKTADDHLDVDKTGSVLVLFGDTPLVTTDTMQNLIAARAATKAAVAVLGFETDTPTGYGRLVTQGETLSAIVEEKDADPEVRKIKLCNAGLMAFDAAVLTDLLAELTNENASGEYYLTDLVSIARQHNYRTTYQIAPEQEVMGINDRTQLAEAEAIFQDRMRQAAMISGVTLVAPETVFFSADTVVEPDVVIEPNVVFGPGVTIARNTTIKAFSHLEGAAVASGCVVGPYARLRPGTRLAAKAKIGNFVEIKKATVEEGAKVNHLSYIGDAHVGAGANIGAGTITCNYDGFNKFQTHIGAGAFVGSNSALVAPVTIGDGAIIGAGSTITTSVEANALAVERSKTLKKAHWAETFRSVNSKTKTTS